MRAARVSRRYRARHSSGRVYHSPCCDGVHGGQSAGRRAAAGSVERGAPDAWPCPRSRSGLRRRRLICHQLERRFHVWSSSAGLRAVHWHLRGRPLLRSSRSCIGLPSTSLGAGRRRTRAGSRARLARTSTRAPSHPGALPTRRRSSSNGPGPDASNAIRALAGVRSAQRRVGRGLSEQRPRGWRSTRVTVIVGRRESRARCKCRADFWSVPLAGLKAATSVLHVLQVARAAMPATGA